MNKEQALQELDEKIAQERDTLNAEVGGSPAYSHAAGKIAAYNQAKKLLRRVEE